MSVYAKIIKDSISEYGFRLTTMEVSFHRFVLPEFNTHRLFSRNFRSSRAVPTNKLIEEVRTNPAMPVFWGKNQPGMQAAEELSEIDKNYAINQWSIAAFRAAEQAEFLLGLGVHKQIVNRVLEPFLYTQGVVSFTNFENFRQLRCHPDAQPEIKFLADKMAEAYDASVPEEIDYLNWHLPYIDEDDMQRIYFAMKKENAFDDEICVAWRKVSAARCARVSYKVFDEDRKPTLKEDLDLFDKLAGNQPLHASPLEHQATPDRYDNDYNRNWVDGHKHGNFEGWVQFRKTIPGEFFEQPLK